MTWAAKLLEHDRAEAPLPERIDALLADQRTRWPALAEGEASLASLETKVLDAADGRVVVQANPGRRRSTHAKVDAASLAARPCFLCPGNMPPQERGIAWRDLVILPNPYPILPRHLTIPSREHQPQRLAGRVESLLQLAHDLGSGMAAFYNGPRCGASAPDHFHFQACESHFLPVFDNLSLGTGHVRRAAASFGRFVILFASLQLADIAADLSATLDALSGDSPTGDEPMVNVLATMHDGQLVAALFPRGAHRPRCYAAEDARRLAVSPAALEMAGVLVVAEPEHFPRVDAAAVRGIYEDVSIEAPHFDDLLRRLAQRQVILEQ